jgi:membrane protease YdiL (CAAX protease family)
MLAADAPPVERWQVRLLLGISHIFTFLIAGWAVLRFFYPPNRNVWKYIKADKVPDVRLLLTGIFLILLAIPLVLFTYNLNQALPLPESLRMLEEQANESIKGLLQMDNGLELFANLFLIALLPALGEELVFRGVVQQQLMRRMGPWVAIVLGAAIFSFIHFQFEGFLPRMLLGVLLGWLYWRSGNIWVPIGAHFVNNAFQVVGQFLYSRELSTVDLEQDIEVPWLVAAISASIVVGIIFWSERKRFELNA